MNKHKEMFGNYKYEIDFDAAAMFSEHNCGGCNGKGFLEYSHNAGKPIRGTDFISQVLYCDCVRKNSQKYS